jgi:fatty-acyl-CoA synthase
LDKPNVTLLVERLADADDRGIWAASSSSEAEGDSFICWRNHIQDGADLAATLRARLDPDIPPHIGVLLGNTPFFSPVLVAAALSGLVPVGLNPTRRGAALQRDVDHADRQLVLADRENAQDCGDLDTEAIDIESPQWADEVTAHRGSPVQLHRADPDDLFMLLFTSGTSGNPKAVRCTHEKVAFPWDMLAGRFGLGSPTMGPSPVVPDARSAATARGPR